MQSLIKDGKLVDQYIFNKYVYNNRNLNRTALSLGPRFTKHCDEIFFSLSEIKKGIKNRFE